MIIQKVQIVCHIIIQSFGGHVTVIEEIKRRADHIIAIANPLVKELKSKTEHGHEIGVKTARDSNLVKNIYTKLGAKKMIGK